MGGMGLLEALLLLLYLYSCASFRSVGVKSQLKLTRRLARDAPQQEKDGGNNLDLFARQRNKLRNDAEKLRLEAEEMAKQYPAPVVREESVAVTSASISDETEEEAAERVSVIEERGEDKARDELIKKISGNFNKERDSDKFMRVSSAASSDAGRREKENDEPLVETAKGTISESLRAAQRVTSAVSAQENEENLLKTLPEADDVYALIDPWWLRWMTRQAARFFYDNSLPDDDRKLIDLAVALEMKEFMDRAMDDNSGSSEAIEYLSDVDVFESRVQARVSQLRSGGDGNIDGASGVAVAGDRREVFQPFNVGSLSESGENGEDSAFAAIVSRTALDNLQQIVEAGSALRDEAQRLEASGDGPDGATERRLFYHKVVAFVSEVERLDGSLDRLNGTQAGSLDGVTTENASERDTEEEDSSTSDARYLRGAIENAMGVVVEDGEIRSSAERIIKEYFDQDSRTSGAVISSPGAGQVQNRLLRGIFEVKEVNMIQGAAVFAGVLAPGTNETGFTAALEDRLDSSGLKNEIGFMTVMNEKYPSLDNGIASAAMESLLGKSPAVIAYPKSWNSTVMSVVNQDGIRLWRSLLNGAAILSSGVFAGSCLGLLGDDGILAKGGEVPDAFLALAFAPLAINTVANIMETLVANTKGIELDTIMVPTFSIFNFGGRSTYLTQPKTRSDLFDAAAAGVSSALLVSLLVTIVGLQLTADAPPADVVSYPTVSISLLQTNSFIEQLLQWKFPGILEAVTEGSTLHLHWLAIAGAVSFLGNTFQLIPIDNSAGSKMSYAVLGQESYTVLAIIFGFFKFVLIVPALFMGFGGDDPVAVMTRGKILVDYVLSSQIAGSNSENQLTVDGINGVSEGRLILYGALAALMTFALVPFGELATDFTQWVDSSNAYIKSLLDSSVFL